LFLPAYNTTSHPLAFLSRGRLFYYCLFYL
jgi:hypothetical protein